MSDASGGGRDEGGGDRAPGQQRWKSSPRYPEPDDGSSVVGASARVPSRHRANGSPPIADTNSTAAYPLEVKVTHNELLPSVPSATGVSGARPKLALRRTESSLSGKWAPTGATRLERRILAREAAERNFAGTRKGKPSKRIESSVRGRKKDVRRMLAEENDETSAGAKGACATGSSSGTAPERDPAKRDAADARQGLQAMTSVLPRQGKNTNVEGLQDDEMVETRGDADGVPATNSSAIVAVESGAAKRDAAGTIEGSSVMEIVSYGEGRKELVRGSSSEETSESRFEKYFVRSTGEVPGAVGKCDVAAIEAAKREVTNAVKLLPSPKNTSSIRGRKEVVWSPSSEPKAELRGRADDFRPFAHSPGAAAESDAAKRDAADSKEGAPDMMNVSLVRGRAEFPWGPLTEEVSERRGYADSVPSARSSYFVTAKSDAAEHAPVTLEGSQAMKSLTPMRGRKEVVRGLATEEIAEIRDGGPDCVRATGRSSCDVANNDVAAREAVDVVECLLALKSMPPVRGRKAVVRRPLAEETTMMKGDFDGSRPTFRSSSAAPKGDARERDAAYARDVSRGMESISPSRGSKKVAHRPRAKEVIEISDADGAPEDSSSSGVAARSDGPKRYAADVYVPSATGSLSDVAAIRDSVYATKVSSSKESAPSRRKRNYIDRGPPAEGETELMSGASGTSATGSSRSAAPKSAAAKRGAADAKERPLAKKSVPSIRGRNRVREPPTEDQVEMRDGAAGAQGTARLSSAAAKSVAPMRASPMSVSPYRDAAYSREGSLTYKDVSPEVWRKEVVPDPSIEGNAGMRDDSDSNLATGGSSRTAGKRKDAKNNAAESEFVKRAAVETIEGLSAKKSVPLGRGRKKNRAVSPKLRSPDAHLEFTRSLQPEPPRHGFLSAPTPALFLPTDSEGKPAVPRERAANSAWDRQHFVALPDEKDAEPELMATSRRYYEVEDGVVEGDGVGGKGKARVPSGGTCFPSGTSMSLNEGMEEDPGTALKNAQDVILDKLYAARPNKLKDLVQPQEYGARGGYFEGVQQPFEIMVHPNVRIVADIHSYHMEKAEVIGVLAGRLDREKRVLYIQAAVPVKEAARSCGDRGHTEVEMDPVSSFHANERIRSLGMQMVGWYHSHPKFKNIPSLIDVQNQGTFQAQVESDSDNPWVGMIVGRNQSPSDFLFFRNESVSRENREPVACPMLLRTHLLSSTFSTAALATAAAATNATITPPSLETQARQEKDSYGDPTAAAACKTPTHVRDEDFTSGAFSASLALLPPPPPLAAAPSPAPAAEPTPQGVKESPPGLSPQVMTAAPTRAPFPLNGLNASVGGGSTEAPAFGVAAIFGAPQQGVEGGADVLCVEAKGVEREAFQKGAGMRPTGAGGGIGASWVGGSHNLVVGVRARMQARRTERAEVARADATRRMRKARLLAERGNGDAIAQDDAVVSAVGSPSPADNAQGSPFSRVGMASVHPDEAIGGRRAGMAPAPGKGGHYGLAPRVPGQGFSMKSWTHGVEPGVSVESGSVQSSKVTHLGEEEAAGAAARSVVAAVATRFAGGSSPCEGGEGSGMVMGSSRAGFGLGRSVQGSGASWDDRRERLYSVVSAIARDPPLIFSDEVACVLKGREEVCAWAGGGGVEHGIGDDSGSVGEIIGGYGPEMDYVIDSLMCIGRYYARVSGRAKWWGSRGTPALEKLARSMAVTADHMELCPSETDEFVQDACSFLSACFRETNAPRRPRGTAQKRAASGDAVESRPKRARRTICRDV